MKRELRPEAEYEVYVWKMASNLSRSFSREYASYARNNNWDSLLIAQDCEVDAEISHMKL